jgi:uroporphyrin-III C-methyltransferase/precorrin-2 dehydrogenase/sirohydrochlorin ferrochelatase
MNQLPIFVSLNGRKVVLVGEGEAADAKRRLIERAGGICVGEEASEALLAFVAVDDPDEAAQTSAKLKARGLLVNVVDQPVLCDFTTPAIIDRDPLLVAIGTGGASAGLAKALRQRLEALLPASLGGLAEQLQAARERIRAKWPENSARRKAIDAALTEAGILDPLSESGDDAVSLWLESAEELVTSGLEILDLHSTDPDDLTLRQARLLGQADHIFHGAVMPDSLLNRARADAVRHVGSPTSPLPSGLVLHLRLQSSGDGGKI